MNPGTDPATRHVSQAANGETVIEVDRCRCGTPANSFLDGVPVCRLHRQPIDNVRGQL